MAVQRQSAIPFGRTHFGDQLPVVEMGVVNVDVRPAQYLPPREHRPQPPDEVRVAAGTTLIESIHRLGCRQHGHRHARARTERVDEDRQGAGKGRE